MLTNNFAFNSPGKINQNETIMNDDKFINLINNLSELIKTYYYSCKNNNDDIIQSFSLYEQNYQNLISIIKEMLNTAPQADPLGIQEFLEVESHLKTISPQFYSSFEKNKENLKFFIEEAKEIFKQMKYRRYEKIHNNNINKLSNKLIKKKYEFNTNIKNNNNMESYRLNDMRINSKFRIKDDNNNNILNNNTFNTNTYNYYNNSNITNNLDNLKHLIKKISDYNNIIGKISLKVKDNFIKLQNDIYIELERCSNNSIRKSFICNNNNNDVSENTLFNNYSFNFINNNNDKIGIMKKTLFRDFSSNKSRSNNNINDYNNEFKNEALAYKNNLYKNQIKDLEFQIDDLKSTITVLEKTLDDSNKQIDELQGNKNNISNIESKNYINLNNELKKINNNLQQKIKLNDSKIENCNKENLMLKQENIKYKLKISENNNELIKQKEYINKLENEIKEKKENIEEIKNKKNNIDNNEKVNYLKIIEENKKDILLKEKNINELNEKINNQNKDYTIKIKNLNEKNNILSQNLIDKEAEIKNLINKNELQNNEILNLKNIINNNEKDSKIKEYENKINNNKQIIDNLNDLLNKEKNNNNEKNELINKYKNEINELNRKKDDNNNILNDNNILINNLKEEKMKLNDEIVQLKNKISVIEEEKNDIQKNNELNNNDKNEEIEKIKNELDEKNKYINELRNKVINLESQYDKLKLKEDNIIIENESLSKELNIYKNKCDKLQIDYNLNNYNLSKELNELNKKYNIINEESKQINELKIEKEKMLQKIIEYKNNEELNMQQIKALKEHIKEIEKKKNNISDIDIFEGNDDAIEEYNKMRILYEEQLNKNKELENKIHYKDEQIEGLRIVIDKFADEKMSFNEKKKNSGKNINNININKIINNIHNSNSINNHRYNNDKDDEISFNNDKDILNQLKEAKIIINKLIEDKKILEEENKNLKDNNKLLRSEYKSEGGIDILPEGNEEEEYTMKKMVNAAKKRNQSEDIKIDYPGLSNIKQKYDELETKFRKLEEAVLNLLNNLKCTSEIKPMIIDICNALEIGDDMVKQIVRED